MTLNEIGGQARAVSRILNSLGSREKNIGLEEAARALLEGEDEILAANEADYEMARQKGMSQGLLDRLRLTPARVQSMADGLLKVASLEDPVGEVISMKLRQWFKNWPETGAFRRDRHDLRGASQCDSRRLRPVL